MRFLPWLSPSFITRFSELFICIISTFWSQNRVNGVNPTTPLKLHLQGCPIYKSNVQFSFLIFFDLWAFHTFTVHFLLFKNLFSCLTPYSCLCFLTPWLPKALRCSILLWWRTTWLSPIPLFFSLGIGPKVILSFLWLQITSFWQCPPVLKSSIFSVPVTCLCLSDISSWRYYVFEMELMFFLIFHYISSSARGSTIYLVADIKNLAIILTTLSLFYLHWTGSLVWT
jgi:hypothetical protein